MRRHIPDILAVIGAALVSYGAWTAYQPAGFILAGTFCIFIGARIAKA